MGQAASVASVDHGCSGLCKVPGLTAVGEDRADRGSIDLYFEFKWDRLGVKDVPEVAASAFCKCAPSFHVLCVGSVGGEY